MKRVTGIGGIFFKSKNPEKLREWYSTHLGIKSDRHGGIFTWRDHESPDRESMTVWNPFKEDTKYFQPSEKDFMFNYRVENLRALVEELKMEGVTVVGEVEEYEYGKFGWIIDPEGNKIELWEPVDGPLLKNSGDSGQ